MGNTFTVQAAQVQKAGVLVSPDYREEEATPGKKPEVEISLPSLWPQRVERVRREEMSGCDLSRGKEARQGHGRMWCQRCPRRGFGPQLRPGAGAEDETWSLRTESVTGDRAPQLSLPGQTMGSRQNPRHWAEASFRFQTPQGPSQHEAGGSRC